jgi:hypothetical protein
VAWSSRGSLNDRHVFNAMTTESCRVALSGHCDKREAGYIRRLPNHLFEHKTLRCGLLDFTFDPASVIPEGMAGIGAGAPGTQSCTAQHLLGYRTSGIRIQGPELPL